jgi:O-antigen ligase
MRFYLAATTIAVTVGVTVALPRPWPLLALGGLATMLIGALVVTVVARASMACRERVARRLLWLGLLMPFIFVSVKTYEQVGAGAMSPLDLVRGVGGLGCFLTASVIYRPAGASRPRQGVTMVGLVVFLATAATSTLWSVDARATALKIVPTAAAYLLLVQLVRRYQHLDEAAAALATLAHVVLLGVLVQVAVAPSVVYLASGTGPARLSSVAPAIHANLLALFAAVGLLALVLRLGPRRTIRARPLLVPVYVAELLATRTRIAAAVGLALLGVVVARLAVRHLVGVAALCLAGVALVAAVGVLANVGGSTTVASFVRRGQDEQLVSTLSGRTPAWERSLEVWKTHPWLGIGYYSGHRLGLIAQLQPVGADRSNLDSTWIELLVDVGLVGAAGVAVFALAGVIRLVRRRPSRGRSLLLAVALAGVAVSFVNPTLQAPYSGMVLLGFALCAGALPADARKQHHRPTGPGFR